VAAHVGSNDAAPSREEFDLWPPDLSGLGIPVHEDQTFPGTADVATQLGVHHRYAMDGQEILVVGVLNERMISPGVARLKTTLRAQVASKGLCKQGGVLTP
jgi:hypothetical protein